MAKEKKENLNVHEQEWIEDNVVEDKDICFRAAEAATKAIYDTLGIGVSEGTLLPFYGIVWKTIWDCVKEERENRKDEFIVNIADCVELGFTNNDNDDTEKIGSFVPVIHQLTTERPFVPDTTSLKSIERCQSWMTSNIKYSKAFIDKVAIKAKAKLKDVGIELGEKDIVFPLWVITHQSVLSYVKHIYDIEYYKEDDIDTYNFTVNFCGCYDVIVSKDKNNDTKLGIVPNPSLKVDTKDDSRAVRED